MKANRTITREKTMTILYQIFLYNKNKINYTLDEIIDELMEEINIEDRKKIDIEYLKELVSGVLDNIHDMLL